MLSTLKFLFQYVESCVLAFCQDQQTQREFQSSEDVDLKYEAEREINSRNSRRI